MSIPNGSEDYPPTLRKTRFVCVSDTHGASTKDGAFKLPKGDVLIHAGDLTNQGGYTELKRTVEWIEAADFEVKIVVAGNHDITLDEPFYTLHSDKFHNNNIPHSSAECLSLLTSSPSILYLNHAPATVRLSSPTGPRTTFTVFGSPFSPARGLWAFGYTPDAAEGVWRDIPSATDVIITHTPPRGHGDDSPKWGRGAGCEALAKRLWDIRPALAVGGHVHEGRGVEVVRWGEGFRGQEDGVAVWEDPGKGNGKESRVHLTGMLSGFAKGEVVEEENHVRFDGEGMSRLHHEEVRSRRLRRERKETCIVNAAVKANSHGLGMKRFNKPIVVDVELPVWTEQVSTEEER